jgi:pimeloyl-ACP methyl ester carboxylesterase
MGPIGVIAALALIACGLLAGCAAAPPPVPPLPPGTVAASPASAPGAVRTADEGGAPGRPEALLFLVHGINDTPDDWPSKLIEELRDSSLATERWRLAAYNWDSVTRLSFGAARDGYWIGRSIGRRLAAAEYRLLHLVGHSMGAHVIHGMAEGYRDAGGSAYVHMTFLDPFSPRGLLSWEHGFRHFGEGADYAESYVVTDDDAWGTNGYLEHAHNYDISALVPQEYRDERWAGAHWWVVRFYKKSVGKPGPGFGLSPLARGLPRPQQWNVRYSTPAVPHTPPPVPGAVTVLR